MFPSRTYQISAKFGRTRYFSLNRLLFNLNFYFCKKHGDEKSTGNWGRRANWNGTGG
jgi:hypothetical protein